MKLLGTSAATAVVASLFVTAAVAVSAPQARAQSISFACKVNGYSNSGDNGWIDIRPGAGTGGKVVNGGKRNAFTDRIQRGEVLRVSISAPRGTCEVQDTIVGVVADNGFVRGAKVNLPFRGEFVVSRDPKFDNVTAVVISIKDGRGRVVTQRLPIGSR